MSKTQKKKKGWLILGHSDKKEKPWKKTVAS